MTPTVSPPRRDLSQRLPRGAPSHLAGRTCRATAAVDLAHARRSRVPRTLRALPGCRFSHTTTPPLTMLRATPALLIAALALGGCTNYRAIAEEEARNAEAARAAAARYEAALTQAEADREAQLLRANRAETEATRLREELARATRPAPSTIVQNVRGETVDILLTDVFFESASARLSPQGVERLRTVAATLKRDFPGRLIRIEGFTDSRPIADALKDRFRSNWELSAARAASVAIHLQWEHDLPGERMEIVGYGSYRIAPGNTDGNATEAGRSANRRVRIAVLPAGASPNVID